MIKRPFLTGKKLSADILTLTTFSKTPECNGNPFFSWAAMKRLRRTFFFRFRFTFDRDARRMVSAGEQCDQILRNFAIGEKNLRIKYSRKGLNFATFYLCEILNH
jgi:hypothetical protein